jgi:hypothetical protein
LCIIIIVHHHNNNPQPLHQMMKKTRWQIHLALLKETTHSLKKWPTISTLNSYHKCLNSFMPFITWNIQDNKTLHPNNESHNLSTMSGPP